MPVKVLDARGVGNWEHVAGHRLGRRQRRRRHQHVPGVERSDPHRRRRSRLRPRATTSSSSPRPATRTWPWPTPRVPAPASSPSAPSTATDARDTPAGAQGKWGSNYGPAVTVAAPGCTTTTWRGGSYVRMCGTSTAAPLVAALAGLLRSYNPAASGEAVATAIRVSAVAHPDFANGRIDAAAALRALTPGQAPAPPTAPAAPTPPGRTDDARCRPQARPRPADQHDARRPRPARHLHLDRQERRGHRLGPQYRRPAAPAPVRLPPRPTLFRPPARLLRARRPSRRQAVPGDRHRSPAGANGLPDRARDGPHRRGHRRPGQPQAGRPRPLAQRPELARQPELVRDRCDFAGVRGRRRARPACTTERRASSFSSWRRACLAPRFRSVVASQRGSTPRTEEDRHASGEGDVVPPVHAPGRRSGRAARRRRTSSPSRTSSSSGSPQSGAWESTSRPHVGRPGCRARPTAVRRTRSGRLLRPGAGLGGGERVQPSGSCSCRAEDDTWAS